MEVPILRPALIPLRSSGKGWAVKDGQVELGQRQDDKKERN